MLKSAFKKKWPRVEKLTYPQKDIFSSWTYSICTKKIIKELLQIRSRRRVIYLNVPANLFDSAPTKQSSSNYATLDYVRYTKIVFHTILDTYTPVVFILSLYWARGVQNKMNPIRKIYGKLYKGFFCRLCLHQRSYCKNIQALFQGVMKVTEWSFKGNLFNKGLLVAP